MKKNPEDIAYQVLHEVMFAGTDKKSSDAISKLLKQGKIRRIAPKIYTTNFEANGEDIIFAKSKSTIFQKETCKKNSKKQQTFTRKFAAFFLSFEELSKAFQRLFNPMKFCRS